MEDQLVETWQIHDRINRYLLDAIPDAALASVSASKGRSVGEQFAHVHDVRMMWLKAAAPQLLEGLEKLPKEAATDKARLKEALTKSGEAVAALLRHAFTAGGKVKNFKPHAVAFIGYLISHESHHRGHIGLTLKQTGHPLDKKTAFGLWEWGVR
jgi:uncharacterized damage-inducible protein DinB